VEQARPQGERPERDDVAGLVLAAGAGRRFGGPKALVPFAGRTLLEHAVGVLASGGCRRPINVVLGSDLGADLPPVADMRVSWNPEWREGLGSSLRHGLRLLADESPADLGPTAVVIMLVDQPGISPAAVHRLIEAHRGGAVVAVATYGGRRAHPVLLDRTTWAAVRACANGDEGARVFMRANPELVTEVACDDVGIDDDIDTPADLARLVSELEDRRTCM
jgi:nicotine blue oxidoreductase